MNILFSSEDRDTWEKRRAAAQTAREEAKQRLRYDFYIRKQPADDFRPVQQSTLNGIHEKIAEGLPTDIDFPEPVRSYGKILLFARVAHQVYAIHRVLRQEASCVL